MERSTRTCPVGACGTVGRVARSIDDWDPPFPYDETRVRSKEPDDQDERYWEDYRTTPKAFVSEEDGRELWSTRYGRLTGLRVAMEGGEPSAEELRQALMRIVDPEPAGFRLIAIREDGLSGASGATDFSGLFLGWLLDVLGVCPNVK